MQNLLNAQNQHGALLPDDSHMKTRFQALHGLSGHSDPQPQAFRLCRSLHRRFLHHSQIPYNPR